MATSLSSFADLQALTAPRPRAPEISRQEAEAATHAQVAGFTRLAPHAAAFTDKGGDRWVLKRLRPGCDLHVLAYLSAQMRTKPPARTIAVGAAFYLLMPYGHDTAAPTFLPNPCEVADLLAAFHTAVPSRLPITGRHRWFDTRSLLDGLRRSPAATYARRTAERLRPLTPFTTLAHGVEQYTVEQRAVYCHGDLRRTNLWRTADGRWSSWDIDGFCAMPPEYDLQRATWGLALHDHKVITPHWGECLVNRYRERTGSPLSFQLLAALLCMDTITALTWLAIGLDRATLHGRTYLSDWLALCELVPSVKILIEQWARRAP